MNIENFIVILEKCLNIDKTVRNDAELHLSNFKSTNPIEYIHLLVQVLRTTNDLARSISTILLKSSLSMNKGSLLQFLSEEQIAQLQGELFDILKREEVKHIRKKLVYTIAAFLSTPLRQGKAPNLIPMLCEWTKDPSLSIRESSFLLLNQLSNFILDHGLQPYLKILYNTLELGMQPNQPKEVQVAALQATTNLVISLKKKNRNSFIPLTEKMLNVLAQLLNQRAESEAITVIESLIEILVRKPLYFSKTKLIVAGAMLQIAKTKTFNDDVLRQTAMEWITSAIEVMPTMITAPNFVQQIIPACMSLITEIQDDNSWGNDFEDDDEITIYDVGIETLDRICCSAEDTREITSILFSFYQNYSNHEDWKLRFACSISVAQSVEGCVFHFKENLPQLVNMILNHSKDPVPRVRFAAVNSIAQLATELTPFFQNNYHSKIVPTLLQLLNDPVLKIKAYTAISIVNFTEDIDREIIEPYVDALLSNLHKLLQTNVIYLQEQVLIAICALVDCTSHLFLKYYDYFMPFLIQILGNANTMESRKLRGKAIECVSLIANAVGKNEFKDLQVVTSLFLKIQKEAAEDDPAHIYLVQSWARLARCLRHDFLPFLPNAMEEILMKANIDPKIIILDGDEETNELEKDCQTHSFKYEGVGLKRVSIKTSDIEDKSLACNQILNFLDLLDTDMFGYVEQIAKVIVPQLEQGLIDEIRMTSSEICQKLLSLVKRQYEIGLAKPEMVSGLFQYIYEHIIDTLNLSDIDQGTEAIVLDCLQECLKLVKDVLSKQQIETFSTLLLAILNRSLIMKKKYNDLSIKGEDEETLEALQKLEEKIVTEENLQSTIGDVVGALLKSHLELFYEIFIKNFFNVFYSLAHQNASDDEFCTALCVMCDFVEFSGELSLDKFDIYSSLFFSCVNHPSVNAKLASIYGIGVMATTPGNRFDPLIPETLKILQSIFSLKHRKDGKKFDVVIANAASTLFKLIKSRSHHPAVNPNVLLNTWLNILPVTGDWVEAQKVNGNLLDLVEARNPIIMGENYSNIHTILNILSQIINSKGLSESQNSKARDIILSLQNTIPSNILESAWKKLPDKQQRKINNFISQSSS